MSAGLLIKAVVDLVEQTDMCMCAHASDDHPDRGFCIGYYADDYADDIDCPCQEWRAVVPAHDVINLIGKVLAPQRPEQED